MVRGKPISEEIRWVVIWLSMVMSPDDVAMYTDLSVHSIKNILLYFKCLEGVDVPKCLKPQLHRSLCDYDGRYIVVCYLSQLFSINFVI